MEDYLRKDYIRLVQPDEINLRSWYIPTFITNSSNKLRVVFDCAAKVKEESLNTHLFTGPDLISPLIGVLFRFRERPIAVTADICEMFHQISINPGDRKFQRFLWKRDPRTKLPDVYEANVLIFGATSSPFIAQYVKNYHAKNIQTSFQGL